MRRFKDEAGAEWELVVGRETWGGLYAIFIPVIEGEMRQAPVQATGYEDATAQLESLTESELRGMLVLSLPKPMG